MNAKELHDTMAASKAEFPGPAEMRDLILRALRLLAAAEGGELTPECDAAQVQVEFWVNGERREKCTTAIDAPTARRLERERNGLAARVRELEEERCCTCRDGALKQPYSTMPPLQTLPWGTEK